MMNRTVHLAQHLFDTPERAASRAGFGTGVVEAGKVDARIVVITADLSESTCADQFEKIFPERFVQMGVAEQNMAAVAAGMARWGKVPFITSYATFNPGRNWEQIRTTVAINDVPVVVCGMHAGLMTGPDGATHQALEDIALMRAIPRMTVISPCDAIEAHKAVIAASGLGAPVYLRFGREKMPTMTTHDSPFEIGKASTWWKGEKPEVAIFATGPIMYHALVAAHELSHEGVPVSLTNIHTIKPLDVLAVEHLAREAGSVVTVEDHQVAGGLGGAIAESLARTCPTPIEFLGVQDRFGQSGTPEQLYEEYGLGVADIKKAVLRARLRRQVATVRPWRLF